MPMEITANDLRNVKRYAQRQDHVGGPVPIAMPSVLPYLRGLEEAGLIAIATDDHGNHTFGVTVVGREAAAKVAFLGPVYGGVRGRDRR